MEATASPAKPALAKLSFMERHQFLIYRLFSLSGLLPIGGYVVVHLLTNATIVDAPATFQRQVDTIHALGIALPVVEWIFIFIPMLFHALVGMLILSGAVPNTSSYSYVNNVRYLLQRITAVIVFLFILAHVIHLHKLIGAPAARFGGAQFDAHHAASSTAAALQAAVWIQLFYALGVLATAYHLGNGLWTLGITWGIWTSAAAQRRANYLALALGLFVAVTGMTALTGFSRLDVEKTRLVEEQIERGKRLSAGENAGSSDYRSADGAADSDAPVR